MGLSEHTTIKRKNGSLSKGMSKYEILMSGSMAILTDGERPYAFGPHGPSDKELVGEILRLRGFRDRSDKRKSWRELSQSTPNSAMPAKFGSPSPPSTDVDGSSDEAVSETEGTAPTSAAPPEETIAPAADVPEPQEAPPAAVPVELEA